MTPPAHRRLRWQPLWWRWSALMLACALAIAMLAIWRGSGVAARQQQAEQQAVLQEIGRAIANQLERAQQMGIPLQDAVGLEPWLAQQRMASAQVAGLAIIGAGGELLAQDGMPPGALMVLRRPTSDAISVTDTAWVRLPVSGQAGAEPSAWLHVAGSAQPVLWPQVWFTLGLTGVAVLVAALALRMWARRRLGRHLARIHHHLMQMASGHLVTGHVAQPEPGEHAVARLDRALAREWRLLQQQQSALLQKLNEVRAAHFDADVLARIDTLAGPLLQAPATRAAADGGETWVSRGWQRWSLNRRLAVGLVGAWCLALAGLLGIETLQSDRAQDVQAHAQRERLQMAWDHVLAQDLTALAPLVQPALVESAHDDGLRTVMAVIPPHAHWWMRSAQGDVQALAGRAASAVSAPTQNLLDELAVRPGGTRGLWLGSDRHWQVGHARAMAGPQGGFASVVASQPMSLAVDQLGRQLGARLALADHRGQPMGDDPHALVAQWQKAQREAEPAADGGWRVAVPLLSHTGHTIGHLVAELPPETERTDGPPLLPLTLTVWLFLGAGIWWMLLQLKPLGQAAAAIARLADAPDSPANPDVHVGALRRDIARVENRLDVLRALRRSRERQGRRQARFIRHQMLELANRLDADARADVLQDLERIESASLHPAGEVAPVAASTATNPHFERMVDEVGVLALGFQNLVGRVGDQYQQLGQLVQELREALRVKTQFIAIQQELEIARKMQLAFLPHDFSHQAGVQLHGFTQPAREVGGDFYDFFRLDPDHLAVLVADVSGKGVPAAFFMAVSRTLMRAVAQFSRGPADCLQRLNDLLAADNEEMMFVTLFYAVIDTRTGQVTYANAGHNPPYVVRHAGAVEEVPTLGNMALAVMAEMPYTERTLYLGSGDALFLYTDGVTEAAAPDGSWFGEARLERFLHQSGLQPDVAEVGAALLETIHGFESGSAQSDDITCLMVRWLPENPT